MHNRSTKQRRASRRREIAVAMCKLAKMKGREVPSGQRYVELLSFIKGQA